MRRKWWAVGIILLFVGTCVIPAIAQDTEKTLPPSRGNWLYVGGSGPWNYTKIQDAIDNATDGDTVFVYDDSSPYVESVVINKAVCLLGENQNTTEIEAIPVRNTITVNADNIIVSSFTIKDRGCGIWIYSNHNRIQGNIFRRIESFSISLNCEGNENIISNNYFIGAADTSITLDSDRNIISNNYFEGGSETSDGIVLADGNYNTIKDNDFRNNRNGIFLEYTSNNNIIFENTFGDNWYRDCYLSSSHMNNIYHNNFGTTDKVYDNGQNNIWGKGYPSGGNYWQNYPYEDNFSGANQNQPGADGIGDTQFKIPGGNNADYLPLMLPYSTTKLEIVHLNFVKPSMTVKNVGNTTAFIIQWNITIKGGFLFFKKNSSGDVPKPLLPDEQFIVSSNYLLLGFGRTEIIFTTWAENVPVITEKINGILLLFFFRIIEK